MVHNAKAVRTLTQRKLFSVVKANAYGHGAAAVARALEPHCDMLCVANCAEAAELAQIPSIQKEILVFSPAGDIARLEKTYQNYVFTVNDLRDFDTFKKSGALVKNVALKVNTGMNRAGVSLKEVPKALDKIARAGYRLHSVFSHLYYAENGRDNEKQLKKFLSLKNIPPLSLKHLAASAALSLEPRYSFDAVRAGLALYGYGYPSLQPIAAFHTPILKILRVKQGERVSYGGYAAPRDMTLAVLGVGYADGIRRKTDIFNEDRFFLSGGIKCPIIGQVCMDLTVADVSNVPNAAAGRRMTVLGDGLSAEDAAKTLKTNAYEVLTNLFSGRVKREYL